MVTEIETESFVLSLPGDRSASFTLDMELTITVEETGDVVHGRVEIISVRI